MDLHPLHDNFVPIVVVVAAFFPNGWVVVDFTRVLHWHEDESVTVDLLKYMLLLALSVRCRKLEEIEASNAFIFEYIFPCAWVVERKPILIGRSQSGNPILGAI